MDSKNSTAIMSDELNIPILLSKKSNQSTAYKQVKQNSPILQSFKL